MPALPRVPCHDLSRRVDPAAAVLAREYRLQEETRLRAIETSRATAAHSSAPPLRPGAR